MSKKPKKLFNSEIEAILDAIREYGITSLHFVGGEPGLYVPDINRILARVPDLKHKKIRITTNGFFGATKASARKLMSSFMKLNFLQLSYDKFHEKFLPFSYVRNLYDVCRETGIEFSVAVSIQSPLDLIMVRRLRKLGDFPIGVLKVMPVGSAKKNKVAYTYPSLDKRVFLRKCPNHKTISYMCGEGFTGCCSVLSFGNNSSRFAHPTMRAHLNSSFYKLISGRSFGEIMKLFKVHPSELGPEHSSSCTLCGYLFNRCAISKK